MPVIYIHGVNTRSPEHGVRLESSFSRWFAPHLGEDILYLPVYWGDLVADQFRWDLKSRPKSQLLGMGAEDKPDPLLNIGAARSAPLGLAKAPIGGAEPLDDGLLGRPQAAAPERTFAIATADPARRGDIIADLYLAVRAADAKGDPAGDILAREGALGALAAAADDVASRWEEIVVATDDDPSNAEALVEAVEQRLASDGLIAAGAFGDLAARAREAASRIFTLPGDVVSTVLGELRPTANAFVAAFLGDVLTYLHSRDRAGVPAEIPVRVLDALAQAKAAKEASGQPIVVVTHSMGGQLFYDAITHYAGSRADLAGLEVDHWFSCGSQVSFFAELGLFRGQDVSIRAPRKLAMPAAVRRWVNFYDVNDMVGFAMKEVFDGVEDQQYDTGYGLALAHTGYLARPSFFRAMAQAL